MFPARRSGSRFHPRAGRGRSALSVLSCGANARSASRVGASSQVQVGTPSEVVLFPENHQSEDMQALGPPSDEQRGSGNNPACATSRLPGAWLLAAALVAASLAVRLPRLAQSIWYDEYCRTRYHLNAETLHERLFQDVHHPLYNLLMFGWTGLFGDGGVMLRLPTLIAGYLSAAVFAAWAALRFGRAAGWIIAAWILLSPVHVWYSTEAKNNMLSLMMAALCIIAYDMMATTGRRAWAAGAVAVGVLGFYTDLIVLLTLVPVFLASCVRAWGPPVGRGHEPTTRAQRRRVLWVGAATVALCLPLVIYKAGNSHTLWRPYIGIITPESAMRLFFGYLLQGNALVAGQERQTLASLLAATLAAPLLVMGFLRLRRSWSGRLANASVLGPTALMVAASLAVDHFSDPERHGLYQDRNMIGLLYPFGLMLVVGAGALRRACARRAAWGLLIAVNAAASTRMVTALAEERTVMDPNPPWREVAAAVRSDARGSPAVIFSKSPVHPILLYWPEAQVRCGWGDPPRNDQMLEALAAHSAGKVYYIEDGRWWPLTEPERQRVGSEVGLREHVRVRWVTVYRLGVEN